jgi:hypothetical protein
VKITSLVSSLAALLALGVAVTLQFTSVRDVQQGDTTAELQTIGLAEKIPLRIPQWTGRDEALGPNEFIESEVEKALNYDDVVNRIYQKGGSVLGVYAAYWAPGRMPVQKVASHTPDRCWVSNGWNCLDYQRQTEGVMGREDLVPAQWREFQPANGAGSSTYVYYWHLVGGELYDYGEGLNPSLGPIAWWRETVHYALKGSADQYFIRMSSNRPFEEIQDDPGVRQLMEALADLGLRARSDV